MPLFNRACLLAGLCLSPLLQAENDQFTVHSYGDYQSLSLASLQQQYPQLQISHKYAGWGDHHSKLTQHLYTGNFFGDVSFIDQTLSRL